jgi:adenylate cyclase
VLEEQRIDRRLAAILAADAAGYSCVMGLDEVGTLRAVKAFRTELIDPAVAARHGRIVKLTGDGILVEFRSAVDALSCPVAVQRTMTERIGASSSALASTWGTSLSTVMTSTATA